ncbi:MAG: glycosyltransferase family 4 protein [Elusimicrobia bacterium]|nr:glycosyltransferase family 4 protein [Elusimicrobiota bacterium]
MRVLLNGIPLLSPRSGVGNYVYFLGEALRRVGPEHEWMFHYLTFQSSMVRNLPSASFGKVRRQLRNVPGMYTAYRVALELFFRVNTYRKNIDLYHETNYAPFPFRGPTVVTVYDLSFLYYPETHPKERVKFYERYFYPRLSLIRHFLAISESVKREMVKDLHIAADRITVTPLGLDAQYTPAAPGDVKTVTAKFGLTPGHYIISVGTKEPRKNLKRLLAAYAKLSPSLRERFPLAVVGGAGWLFDDWKTLLSRWGLSNDVKTLGYVPQEHLPVLYSGATLLAYPSLYEGFGLPLLEAMGCGCPVLTSNVSSLPEVVGNAGVQVDPMDVDGLSAAMSRLLDDPAERERLRALGLERAKGFGWDQCAALTLKGYAKAMGPSHPLPVHREPAARGS